MFVVQSNGSEVPLRLYDRAGRRVLAAIIIRITQEQNALAAEHRGELGGKWPCARHGWFQRDHQHDLLRATVLWLELMMGSVCAAPRINSYLFLACFC